MNDLIREDYVLGNKKIVVGDNLHDLVLENLGKIWIRYGNSYKEFSSFVSTLNKSTKNTDKIVIETNGVQTADFYTDGQLIFDAQKQILYLKYKDNLLLLLEYNDNITEKYVSKTGDTMTGALKIEVRNGAPLYVNSNKLVKDFNANYLEGHTSNDFLQKEKDEEITGNWIFQGHNTYNGQNDFNNDVTINGKLEANSTSEFSGKATFNNEIEVKRTASFQGNGTAIKVGCGDIVTDGSIGSSQFMSGMSGYGWRLDANSNTLTIDNLIVRGVLNVFELIVNKISATNGSLWITDSFKIDQVHEIKYLNFNDYLVNDYDSYTKLINTFELNKYYVVYGEGFSSNETNKYTVIPDLSEHPFATRNEQDPNIENNTFDKFRYIFKIIDLNTFLNEFKSNDYRKSLSVLTKSKLIELHVNRTIQLSNMFQEDPKTINEYEYITESEIILPWAKTNFEDQKFTIVDASQAILTDGQYTYDSSALSHINLYCKYFGSTLGARIWVLECKHDEFPVFKPGDILKCQKFEGKNVKQYHALVLGLADNYSYIIQLQNSSTIQDGTILEYDENGTLIVSNTSNNDIITGSPSKDDALVRIGSIFFNDRRNSVYLTSSEKDSPYTDVLVGVNRPDYSVTYLTPKYVKFEASQLIDGNYRKGTYYLQNDEFANIMQSHGGSTPNTLAVYNKYKDFSIQINKPESKDITTDIREVYLTFLPTSNTLYGHSGLPLMQTIEGINYYMSDNSSDQIINSEIVGINDVISGVYSINNQDATLAIGRTAKNNNSTIDKSLPINYVTPENINEDDTRVTYNGLIRFLKNGSSVANNVVKNNNIIFFNSDFIDQINIIPALRTFVQQEDSTFWTTFTMAPVTVTVTLKIYNDNGEETIKIYNTPYNQIFTLPYNDGRAFLLKLDFKIGTLTLTRELKFYKLPDYLYKKYVTNNENVFGPNEYNTLFDLVSETPVITKWGCLLLTNDYDVVETTQINNELKGVAELISTTKVRMGNLNGIYNETLGINQPHGFGLYGDSVYLTGNFYLNNGKSLVDISNEVTLAVGNINRIYNTLRNLSNSLSDSIYNLTIAQAEIDSNIVNNIEAAKAALTATFNEAISNNNDALFKLGKDYSLWAVGNAGISIINPNVSYDENGNINEASVGDGDEYILLQGESVQIATNIVKNGRIKIVCSNSSPESYLYNNNLYFPTGPSGLSFTIGWITQSTLQNAERHVVEFGNITTGLKPYRYVALTKTSADSGQRTLFSGTPSKSANCNVYSFSTYLTIPGSSIFTSATDSTTFADNTFYVIQDVSLAGMFEDGKFNADLINVENLVAVQSGYKNPNFDPSIEISSSNHPVQANSEDIPYAVISGTTGKITAVGVNLKEATVGNAEDKHIHITDNQGSGNNNRNEGTETNPGIYIKSDAERTIAKFTGNNDNIFNNFTETSVNLNGSNSFDILSDLVYVNRVWTTSPIQFNIFNGGNNSNLTLKNLIFICKLSNSLRISDINVASVKMYKQNMSANTYTEMSNNVSIDNNAVIVNPENSNDTYIIVIQLNSFTLGSNVSISKTLSSNINNIKIIGWDESNSNNQIYTPLDNSLIYSLKIQSITSETLIVYTTDTVPSLNSDISTIQYQTNQIETPQTETLSKTFSLLKNSTINISGSININFRNANPLEWDDLSNNPLIIKNNNKNYRLSPHIAGSYCITLELYLDNSLIQSWQYVQNILKINKRIGTTAYPQLIFDEVNHFGTVKLKDYLIDITSGDHTLSFVASYSFEQSGSLNDYKSYDVSNLTGQETIVCDSFGQCHASYTNSDITIDNNATYYWEPLLCPSQYSLHPGLTVDISSMNINLVTPKTIVQSNGFITGFNNSNYFGQCFNSGQFKFDYIINDFGQTLNNSEWNYHILESKIPVSIPILQGTVLYDSFKRSYDFNGTSLINVQTVHPSSIMSKEIYSNDMIIYSPGGLTFIDSVQSITRDGRINYNYKYDLYFQTIYHSLNQYGSGRCNILFGYKWEKLFRSYGTNVFVQVFGKYSNDGTPITAHLFHKHTNSIYFFDENNNRIKGNECIEDINTNDFVLNYLLGIQINLYELNQQFTDGNFDIMIYYTPNF